MKKDVFVVGPKREKCKYFKMNRSTKRVFLRIIYDVLTFVYVSSCCFPQRTYMAAGHINGAPNEAQTHLCRLVSRIFFQVLYRFI